MKSRLERGEALTPHLPQKTEAAASVAGELQPEDFYFEGQYMVFTAAYHRKRGYCCNSDCRHCPYREP